MFGWPGWPAIIGFRLFCSMAKCLSASTSSRGLQASSIHGLTACERHRERQRLG